MTGSHCAGPSAWTFLSLSGRELLAGGPRLASQDCFSRGELQNPSVHCACFPLLFTLHLRPLAPPAPKGGWISVPPTSILTVVLCGGSFPSLASRVPFLLIPSQQLSGDRSPSPARQFSSGRMASMSQLPCLLGTGTAPECSSGLGTVQERAQESATSCVGFLTQSCWGSEGWLEWHVPRGFS